MARSSLLCTNQRNHLIFRSPYQISFANSSKFSVGSVWIHAKMAYYFLNLEFYPEKLEIFSKSINSDVSKVYTVCLYTFKIDVSITSRRFKNHARCEVKTYCSPYPMIILTFDFERIYWEGLFSREASRKLIIGWGAGMKERVRWS